MKRSMKLAAGSAMLAVTLLGASACASYDYGPRYRGDHYRARVVYHSGYYDGFYGSVYDGYWGPDRYFYYRNAPGGAWIVDRDNHFRHDRFRGGVSFRYRDGR